MRHRKNKTMKGGFWDTFTNMFKKPAATPSSYQNSAPAQNSYQNSAPAQNSSPYTPSSPSPSQYDQTPYGGKRRTRRMRRRRTVRGGYSANRSLNNLAANASSFSGNKTAQPQVWLGGKSRKHRHNRRCKH